MINIKQYMKKSIIIIEKLFEISQYYKNNKNIVFNNN